MSIFALALLLSGLPWAKSWGSYLKAVRKVAEGTVAKQDWSVGHVDEMKAGVVINAGTRAMTGEHAEHDGMTMAHPATSLVPLDRLMVTVRPLALAPPVLIAPPAGIGQPWTAKSDAADQPLRTDLTLDGATGAVLTRKDFAERRLIDRIVGYGIAAHEGQLFGVANQLLGLFTAIGLMLLSVSSIVLWRRRKPDGVLGAPPARSMPPVAVGFVVVLIALGLFLPLLGASMMAVLVVEWLVLRRIPRAHRWLGLRPKHALLSVVRAEPAKVPAMCSIVGKQAEGHHCAVGLKKGIRTPRRSAGRAAGSLPSSMRDGDDRPRHRRARARRVEDGSARLRRGVRDLCERDDAGVGAGR